MRTRTTPIRSLDLGQHHGFKLPEPESNAGPLANPYSRMSTP